jgi:hypothetical protein
VKPVTVPLRAEESADGIVPLWPQREVACDSSRKGDRKGVHRSAPPYPLRRRQERATDAVYEEVALGPCV